MKSRNSKINDDVPSHSIFAVSIFLVGALLAPANLVYAVDYSSPAYTNPATVSNPREASSATPSNSPVFGGGERVAANIETVAPAPTTETTAAAPSQAASAGRRSRASSRATSAQASTDAKSVPKDVKPLVAKRSPWAFNISAGYQTTYLYHGLDVIGSNSNPNNIINTVNDTFTQNGLNGFYVAPTVFNNVVNAAVANKLTSDIVFVSGSVDWKGFHLGLGYSRALHATVPYKTTLDFLQDSLTNSRAFNSFYRSPFARPDALPSSRYSEFNVNLNYTAALTRTLNATIGYNSFIIPEHAFRNTNYIGELTARLTYSPWSFLDASFTYYRYFSDARVPRLQSNVLDNFFVTNANGTPGLAANQNKFLANGPTYLNGGYFELRLDGKFNLIKRDLFQLRFLPYVLISYNNGFFTRLTTASPVASGPFFTPSSALRQFTANDGKAYNEFNTVEAGARLQATYGRISVTGSVNYGADISGSQAGNSFNTAGLTGHSQNWWGGVTVGASF